MKYLSYLLLTLSLSYGYCVDEKQTPIKKLTPADAKIFLDKGNYQMAFKIDKYFAERGDDRSQFNLAVNYFEGMGDFLEKDLIKAYAWMTLSTRKSTSYTRTMALRQLNSLLSDEDRLKAINLSDKLFAKYGTGNREIINAKQKLYMPLNEKPCYQTGSNIKGKCIDGPIKNNLDHAY